MILLLEKKKTTETIGNITDRNTYKRKKLYKRTLCKYTKSCR